MTERGIRVVTRETVRSARYALVGEDPAKARRYWIVLHGYGQLAPRFLRSFENIVPSDTCVVAPEGLSRFYLAAPSSDGSHLDRVGATWMTRESRDTDIEDAITWLNGVYHDVVECNRKSDAAPAVGVLAFSQGVATAMRWIANGLVKPHTFVVWAGGLANDVQDERMREGLRGTQVWLVAGDTDRFASQDKRFTVMETLRRYDVEPHELIFSGDHHLDEGVLAMLLKGVSRDV